jgi:hypothetical protein
MSPPRKPKRSATKPSLPPAARMRSAPVATSRRISPGSKVPSYKSVRNGLMIAHSEMFMEVISTATTFQAYSRPCNPSGPSMFPWLCEIAARYESYKFRKLQFEFYTRVATTAVGNVTLAFDLDAADPAPSSMMEALSFHDSAGEVPWQSNTLEIDLAQGDRLPMRYTRVSGSTNTFDAAAAVGFTGDIKTYDLGNLFVCLDGVAAGAVGFVTVRYEVELYTPQLSDPIGGSFSALTGLSADHLTGNVPTLHASASLPFYVNGPGTNNGKITFTEPFEGYVDLQLIGTGLAGTTNGHAAGSTTAIWTPQYDVINTAQTSAQHTAKIKALAGDSFTPETTATTVTNIVWSIAKALYNAFV